MIGLVFLAAFLESSGSQEVALTSDSRAQNFRLQPNFLALSTRINHLELVGYIRSPLSAESEKRSEIVRRERVNSFEPLVPEQGSQMGCTAAADTDIDFYNPQTQNLACSHPYGIYGTGLTYEVIMAGMICQVTSAVWLTFTR